MAGDWIKVEHATMDKPEVLRIADLLGISRRETIGLLLDFWVWLDRNVRNADSVTIVTHMSRKSIDELTHCAGFAACLVDVGWATIDDKAGVLAIINGERHNGNPAKTRALGKDRASRSRNADTVTREEKRREEKSLETKAVQERWQSLPKPATLPALKTANGNHKATRLAESWFLPDDWRDWAVKVHHVDPQRAVRISVDFRDYWHAKAGADACKRDWLATWRRWVRKECGDDA